MLVKLIYALNILSQFKTFLKIYKYIILKNCHAFKFENIKTYVLPVQTFQWKYK